MACTDEGKDQYPILNRNQDLMENVKKLICETPSALRQQRVRPNIPNNMVPVPAEAEIFSEVTLALDNMDSNGISLPSDNTNVYSDTAFLHGECLPLTAPSR